VAAVDLVERSSAHAAGDVVTGRDRQITTCSGRNRACDVSLCVKNDVAGEC